MKRIVLMLGVLALAGCGSPPEPEDGPSPSAGPARLEPLVLDLSTGNTPSIRGLIGERQRLSLTGPQVTTLDSLAIRLAAANDSLRAALRQGWDGDRPRPGTERWERTRPILTTIAENNRNAGLLVQQVLNEDQRRIACEIEAELRARREREAPVRTAPRGGLRLGGRDQDAADSLAVMRPRGWPGCPPPAPAERRR